MLLYDGRSRGAESYRELARELMARNGLKPPRADAKRAAQAEVRFWPYS